MADPAEIEPQPGQDDAQPGAQDGNQTHGDPADARQQDDGNQPEASGDDSDKTSDPLVLAQMEPDGEAPPATAVVEPPKTTTPTKTTATPAQAGAKQDPPKAADQAKPAEVPPAKDEIDPDEALALEDIPAEDWQKGVLSHKAKSQFLAQRKVIRGNAERLKAEATARKTAEERYTSVEKFVRDQGLEDEEYVNTVAISGLIKRGDPRAIPVLEKTLLDLRTKTGQPAQPATPAAPQLDDDLAAMLQEAEDVGIDTSKVRARFQTPAKAQQAPAQTQQPAPPAAAQSQGPGDQSENQAIIDSLVGLGVENPVEHVQALMAANPSLASEPAGKRLKAIITAHSAAASKAQPTQRQQITTPLSGRRSPPVLGGGRNNPAATNDPLKLALAPARGR